VVLWVTGVSDSRTEPDRPDTMSLQLAAVTQPGARCVSRFRSRSGSPWPDVFDVRGALVRGWSHRLGTRSPPGRLGWRNEARQMVAAGVYILRLEGEHAVSARKVALAR